MPENQQQSTIRKEMIEVKKKVKSMVEGEKITTQQK